MTRKAQAPCRPAIAPQIDSPAIQADLDAAELAGDQRFYLQLTEAQVFDLACGLTPRVVQAMALTLLEWEDLQRRQTQARARREG